MSQTPQAQVVQEYLRLIVAGKVDDAYALMSDDFVQHNPSLPGDKQSNIAAFKQMSGSPRPVYETKRIFTDGNYVIVHAALDRGNGVPLAVVDIFRLSNGKIAEHWDVLQPVPDKPTNANTMF